LGGYLDSDEHARQCENKASETRSNQLRKEKSQQRQRMLKQCVSFCIAIPKKCIQSVISFIISILKFIFHIVIPFGLASAICYGFYHAEPAYAVIYSLIFMMSFASKTDAGCVSFLGFLFLAAGVFVMYNHPETPLGSLVNINTLLFTTCCIVSFFMAGRLYERQ
jgi:hypothetical protein